MPLPSSWLQPPPFFIFRPSINIETSVTFSHYLLKFMGKYDFEEQLSDSDNDDAFRHEIAALSTACLPSGDADFSDDEDDDLELVRSIKEQYGTDISNPLSLKPLSSLPPVASDDEDDDFETLRAIQQRFSQYSGGNTRDRDEDVKENKSDLGKSEPDDVVGMPSGNESLNACRENAEQESCDVVENPETCGNTSGFPQAAQTFIEAIKKNRSCQKFVRSKLLHVEARMEEIKELLKRVKTLRDFQVQCKKKIGRALSQKHDARIQLISAAKPRANAVGGEKPVSAISYGPQENSQVACYKTTMEKFPLSFHREKWSKEERENLEKGIIQQFQEMMLQSAFQEPEYSVGLDSIISSVTNIDVTPEIIQDFSGKVKWEQLASRYRLRRSGAECEARWLNHENRLINRDNWTHEEEKQLLFLIQHNGINNWSCVAEKLKTNRTPFQCLARYQRSLNASIMKRDWSEDEDAQLRFAVESFGESNWQAVASALEGRTGTQCSNRWKKTLHPTRQKVGKWSDDEDKRLRVAVTLFGRKSWHRIAQFVPGRTQAQCRERWCNVLDPFLNHGKWTEEEDLKLKEAIVRYGYCWSKIAACVPMRTDNQCRRRWKRLFPHEVPLLQAARNIQKVALISNFVDRESERPALGPSDFVPLSTEGSTREPDLANVPQKQKKSRNTLEEARTRKCRKRARSPEVKRTGDCGDDGNNDGDKIVKKKRLTHNSGSKKKRCSGNANTATELNRKRQNKEAEETGETKTRCRDVPVNTRSRRPQRARSKANPRINDFNVLQDTDLDDTDINTAVDTSSGENNDPEELRDQLMSSGSQLKISKHKEVDALKRDYMERKQGSLELKQEASLIVPTLGTKSCVTSEMRTSSSDSTKTLSVASDGSSKRKLAKSMHKQSKLYRDQTKKWEDLPLSVLFSEAVMCLQRRKSKLQSCGFG